MIKNDEIDLIINTPSGKTPRKDEVKIRSTAVERRIPILTTISGVEASIRAMRSIKTKGLTVKSLQEYHLSSSPDARKRRLQSPHGVASQDQIHRPCSLSKFASFSHASRSGIARSFSNVSARAASRLLSTMIA
jgi:hypothetical protein